MRIAIAGIAAECCSFSPLQFLYGDFAIQRGEDLAARYPFLAEYRDSDFVPIMCARAGAGGSIAPSAYRRLCEEIAAGLSEKGPWDGLYLDMHGAMHVAGLLDAELDFLRAVRRVVGSECFVAASYDLHGNLSRTGMECCDILTGYRTAPHEDMEQTRERAMGLLVRCLRDRRRLERGYVALPLALPGERVMTSTEPGRSVYAKIDEILARPGITDATILTGYVWVDEPRNHASVVVLGEEPAAVDLAARDLADGFWRARKSLQFGMPTGTVDECITRAIESEKRPFFISDAGDNLTGGGVGDVPFVIERLVAAGVDSAVFAAIADAAAVETCFQLGLGAEIEIDLGGKLDTLHGTPLPVRGRVTRLETPEPGNRQAVVAIGGVRVILTELRTAFTGVQQFARLGIDLRRESIVAVKLGYLFPELRDVAAESHLALSPGAINPDVTALPYEHISRPLFPFYPDMVWGPPVDTLIPRR